MKLPSLTPVTISSLTKEQFDAEMQLGMDDIGSGRVVSAETIENEMRKMYGV